MPLCRVLLRGRKPRPAGYPERLETVGDHLLKRRHDLGLEQKELAERLGVHASTLCKWEKGRVSPRIDHWGRIVKFLGYHPGEPSSTLPGRLVRLREVLGASQPRLAALLGVDPSTVWRWESGRMPPLWFQKRLESLFSEHGV